MLRVAKTGVAVAGLTAGAMRIPKTLSSVVVGVGLAIAVVGCGSSDSVVGSDDASARGHSSQGTPGDTNSDNSSAKPQDFRVESGFSTGIDSIGTRYTSAGARLTNPNAELAAYDVKVLFNLLGSKGNVLDSDTETVAYVGPGEDVPVAPLQIGFDLRQEPTRLQVRVVGHFTRDQGPRDNFGGKATILNVKAAKIVPASFGTKELSGQVRNPTKKVIEEAAWDCIFLNGKRIVGGSSSSIIDPIPPGTTVHFEDSISLDQLSAKTVECRVVSGF